MSIAHTAFVAILIAGLLAIATPSGAAHADIDALLAVARRAADAGEDGAREFLQTVEGGGTREARRRGADWLMGAARRGVPEAQFQVGLELAHAQPPRHGEALEWYRKAADQGFVPACNNLGAMYATGEGVARDEAVAIEWSLKAAERGSATSQARLGTLFMDKDGAKAVHWLEKAAAQGHAGAMGQLGGMYLLGRGVPADRHKAVYWSRKAVELGEADAKPILAAALRDEGNAKPPAGSSADGAFARVRELARQSAAGGDRGARHFIAAFVNESKAREDATEGFKWLLGIAANNGDAAYVVATTYAQGSKPDHERVVGWLEKGARMGSSAAQDNLAAHYYQGLGTAKDMAKAVEWSTKAAEQGSVASQSRLGAFYLTGDGVPKDLDKGLYWLRRAAAGGEENAKRLLAQLEAQAGRDAGPSLESTRRSAEAGDAAAQHRLGIAYYRGNGVAKDEAEAVRWFEKSAAQGHAGGQYALAFMLASGRGVERDHPRAAKLFRLSADQGNVDAMVNLGQFYEKGLGGMPKDRPAARALYLRASARGSKAAADHLKRLDAGK